MERLYLGTRVRKTDPVDRRQCLPSGDCLPSWTNVMLCSKFPMIENPKTPAVLHTTSLCEPKYRYNIDYDFDLTDPNGHTLSLEYHPLHDPHLKAHFNTERMRKHLVRNGFITESGKVVCTLQEFNKYRRFLRRICLMELDRERKNKKEEDRESPDEKRKISSQLSMKSVHDLEYRLKEIRKRNIEKQESNRIRFEMSIQFKNQKFERRKEDLKKRRVEMERNRRVMNLRRQQTINLQLKERQEKNRSLLKRWRQNARNHQMRQQEHNRQRLLNMQQKSQDWWNLRKHVQEERLRRENEFWNKEEQKKCRNIEARQKMMEDRRKRQYDQLERIKRKARDNKEKREARYAKRLAERFAAGDFRVWTSKREQKHKRKEDAKSPRFKSLWTLESVLAEWLISDSKLDLRESKQSREFLKRVTETIDDAVDLVTEGEDGQLVQSESERQLRSIAADYINDLIAHVKDEIYPAYLNLLESEKSTDTFDDYFASLRQGPKDSEEVLYEEDFFEDYDGEREREVHFDEHESLIPRDEEFPAGDKLLSVSRHIPTPVASQTRRKPKKEDTEIIFVESLLRRLIEDLNAGKLSREDLLKLTAYSMEILRRRDTEEKKLTIGEDIPEGSEKSSSFIASEIVRFTLSKILDEIKSGSVSDDQLTSLTISILNDRQEPTVMYDGSRGGGVYTNEAMVDKLVIDTLEKALEKPSSDENLDRLITKTLLEATKILSAESNDELDILIAKTIADAKRARESLTVRSMDTNDELDVLIARTIANAKSAREALSIQSAETSEELDMLIARTIAEAKYAQQSTTRDSLDTNEELDILIAKTIAEAKCGRYDSEEDSMNEYAVEDFIVHTLERILSDLKQQKLSKNQVLHIASSISTVVEGVSSSESKAASDVVRRVLTKILREVSIEGLESNAVQKVVSAVVTSYHSIQSQRSSSLLEAIESFVFDVLKTIVDLMQQGQLSDSDLNDMSVSFSTKYTGDSRLGREPIELDSKESVTKTLEKNINDVLEEVENNLMPEDKLRHIGKILLETGGKLLGIDVEQYNLLQIESVASSDVADQAVNEIFEDIHREWERVALDKEDVKTLAVSILKSHHEKQSESEAVSHATPSPTSYSPTDSAIAENLVLQVMDKINEDIGGGRIPHHALSSIATSVISLIAGGPTTTPGTVGAVSSIKSTASDITDEMRSVLYRITACLKADSVDFYDAQNIFGVILDRYTSLVVDTKHQHADTFIAAISESTMVENLITETLSKIRRDITIGAQSLHDIVPEAMYSESKEKAESVNSLFIDKLINATLEQVNKRFEPTEDIYATLSADSTIVEHLVRDTLSKIAGEIKDSPSSTIDTVPSVLIDALVRGTLSKIKRGSLSALNLPESGTLQEEEIKPCAESGDIMPVIGKTKSDKKHFTDSGNLILSSYTVDFVESIVMQLISFLDSGDIPPEAVVYFAKRLVESCSIDTFSMTLNDIKNVLVQVLLDIRESGASSVYYHRIVDAFSKKATEYGHKDLKAVCTILSNVDASVLVQFVRTTLENILVGVQKKKDEKSQHEIMEDVKETIEARCQTVAQRLVRDVIRKVEQDFMETCPDYMEKEIDERAIAKILSDTATKKASTNEVVKPSSASDVDLESVPSTKIEEFVLMTLHNAISDSLFEQTMAPRGDESQRPISPVRSSLIYQFVLEKLQDVVEEKQQYYTDSVVVSPSKLARQSGEVSSLSTVTSSNLGAYINNILLDSIKAAHASDTIITDIMPQPTTQISRVMSSQIDRFVLRTIEGIILREEGTDVPVPKSSTEIRDKAIKALTKVKSGIRHPHILDASKHILMDSFANLEHGEDLDIFVESLVNAAITQISNGELRNNELVKIQRSGDSEIEVTGQKIMEVTSALAAVLETESGREKATKSDHVQSWINTVPTASLGITEVKDVITGTLKQTASNVRDGQLDSEALHVIASALSDKMLLHDDATGSKTMISPVESGLIERYVAEMLEKSARSSSDVREQNIKTIEKLKFFIRDNELKCICRNVITKFIPELKPEQDICDIIECLINCIALQHCSGRIRSDQNVIVRNVEEQIEVPFKTIERIVSELRCIAEKAKKIDETKFSSHLMINASQELVTVKDEITLSLEQTVNNLEETSFSYQKIHEIASTLSDKLLSKDDTLNVSTCVSPTESAMIEKYVTEMLDNVAHSSTDEKDLDVGRLEKVKSSLHKPEVKDVSKQIVSETFGDLENADFETFVSSLVDAAIAHVSSNDFEKTEQTRIRTSSDNELVVESKTLVAVASALATAVEDKQSASEVEKTVTKSSSSVDLTEIKNILNDILKQTVSSLKQGKFSSQELLQLSLSLSTSRDEEEPAAKTAAATPSENTQRIGIYVVDMLEKVINSLVDLRNKAITKLVKVKSSLHRQDVKKASRQIVLEATSIEKTEDADNFIESLLDAAVDHISTGRVLKDDVMKITKSSENEIEVTADKVMDITSALVEATEKSLHSAAQKALDPTVVLSQSVSDPKDQKQIMTEPTKSLDLTEVKDVISETLKQTVANVKEGKLSSESLLALASSLSKQAESEGLCVDLKDLSAVDSDVVGQYVVDMLEVVIADVDKHRVDTKSLMNIIAQFGESHLKEEVVREDGGHSDQSSSASVSSERIAVLIEDILNNIAVSLEDDSPANMKTPTKFEAEIVCKGKAQSPLLGCAHLDENRKAGARHSYRNLVPVHLSDEEVDQQTQTPPDVENNEKATNSNKKSSMPDIVKSQEPLSEGVEKSDTNISANALSHTGYKLFCDLNNIAYGEHISPVTSSSSVEKRSSNSSVNMSSNAITIQRKNSKPVHANTQKINKCLIPTPPCKPKPQNVKTRARTVKSPTRTSRPMKTKNLDRLSPTRLVKPTERKRPTVPDRSLMKRGQVAPSYVAQDISGTHSGLNNQKSINIDNLEIRSLCGSFTSKVKIRDGH